MTIELLPPNGNHRDISSLLSQSLTNCQSVKGSIAFWTLDIDALGGSLLKALQKSGSEMYVDMQWPTDYTKLAKYFVGINSKPNSPKFFICVRKQEDNPGLGFSGLLHTKLLLFDMGNENWEIWVGSHNFTKKAVHGANLEASLCIRGHLHEPQFKELVQQVQEYLKYIKAQCEPFDPEKINYYGSLRGTLNENNLKETLEQELSESIIIEDILISRILAIQSKNAHKLAGQTIILMGNLSEELNFIRHRNRGGRTVLLRVRDSDTDTEYTYEARFRAFDNIDNLASKNVSFNARPWVIRKVSKVGEEITPPLLRPAQDVNQLLIEANKYYVNIDIQRLLENEIIRYFTYPETNMNKLWRTVQERDPKKEINLLGSATYHEKTENQSAHMVPVANAEQLTSIHPVEWGENFTDGLLERRIVALGKSREAGSQVSLF